MHSVESMESVEFVKDYFITDRVRNTTVRYCFHRCLSVCSPRYLSSLPSKVPTPLPGPNGGGEGYPKVPTPTPCPRYLPPSKVPTPSKVPMGRRYPRYLPPVQGTYPPPPRIGQHMEYLIRCGRYASCVHAGGLSCSNLLHLV